MGGWTYAVKEELQNLGHRVDAWFADQFPSARAAGRFAILLFPVALALRLFSRRRDYDVVVIHEPGGFWYGLARKLVPGLPRMVAMCHNVESHHFRQMLSHAAAGLARVSPQTRIQAPLLRYWQSNGTIRLADHVVCLSTTDRSYIIRELRVPEPRVTLVVNGTSPRDFVDAANDGGRRVTWVGGWLDVKGRRVLPRLWRRVREKLPDCTLALVGTGADAATVLADFDAADRSSVTVQPRVENPADMRRVYAAGNLYLLTSLSEGSPLSLLEAMAVGLPVVATRVGGVPDIARDGTDALLFDPRQPEDGAAQVCRVFGNPAEARRLAAAGRDRARDLSWKKTAATFAGALQRAAAR